MAATTLPVTYDMDGENAIYRGDTYQRLFRPIYDNNGTATILDTTGWTARMQVRPGTEEDDPVVAEYSTANGRLTTGGINATPLPYALGVFLTHEDTEALPAGFMGFYDVELTDTAGFRQTYYKGRFHVEGDITR